MLRSLSKEKGQNTAEYAVLIGLIVAVVVGMQTYVKRGIQGRVHDASVAYTDGINASGDWANIFANSTDPTVTMEAQYEPEGVTGQSTQQVGTDWKRSEMGTAGNITRESIENTTQATGDYQQQDY